MSKAIEKKEKKICVITGSRCEYGLLYWLLKEIEEHPLLSLQLVATGMHLSPEFGSTYQQIVADGFSIDAKVEMLLSSDTAVGISKSMGLGMISFADVFERLQPNWVVVLGDRFEIFAAASAAFVARIPIVHVHGGELTLGAYDDGFRHSITKMAYLHFTATPEYAQRVMQLGEDPKRIFCVGPCFLDALRYSTFFDKPALEKRLGLRFQARIVLVTYHPETLGKGETEKAFSALLAALANFSDTTIIFTQANADTDGRIIHALISRFCKKHEGYAYSFNTLGQQVYLSLLKQVDLVMGNSSSGVIEAPYFKVPSVNIGDRQKGRIKPASVIDCAPDTAAILQAIQQAQSDAHQKKMTMLRLPYSKGKVAKKIVDKIAFCEVSDHKTFYDMPLINNACAKTITQDEG